MNKRQLSDLLNYSLRIVRDSSAITMKYYGKRIQSTLKENKTPVTIADTGCEKFIIEEIRKKYPSHSIYSEESGREEKGSEFTWIIDPVDGTKNFIRNFPYWGTLLALEFQGEVILGVISMPASNELIYAVKGGGCFLNGKKIKVSSINKTENSFCIFGGLDFILEQDYRVRFFSLVNRCDYNRGFGDCHAHSFIIKGNAEFMIDPHIAPYDVAATKICVEESGGKFTDLRGNKTIYGGDALISNGKVHEKVLRILNG